MKVTYYYLQMLSPSEHTAKPNLDPRFQIREATVKQWQFNRFLYVLVGSDWSWCDKLTWAEAQWRDYAESDRLRTFAAYYDGSPAGFFELLSENEDVELNYFGLAPKFIGRGFGGPLLSAAVEAAWAMKPARVWLHTCTLDHPSALANYQARGFKLYKTELEDLK